MPHLPRIGGMRKILVAMRHPQTYAPDDAKSVGQLTIQGPSDFGCDLPLFRFGLRQLFAFFVAASVFLAILAALPGVSSLVISLITTIVAAHLFATAVGTRLRAHTDRRIQREPFDGKTCEKTTTKPVSTECLSGLIALSISPLQVRVTSNVRRLRKLVIAAAITGGIAGAALFFLIVRGSTSLAGIMVGGVSSAVLCGWFAFLSGNFYSAFCQGFRVSVVSAGRERSVP